MSKITWLISFLLLSYQSKLQTVIVIERLPSEIYVATDARRVSYSKSGTLKYDSVCKIRNYKNIFISIAGTNSDPLYDIALKICKQESGIIKISEQFKRLGKIRYKFFLDSVLKENPTGFNKLFDHLKGVTVAFYGFENNISTVITVAFDATFSKGITVKETINYNIQRPSQGGETIMLGHNAHAIEELNRNQSFFRTKRSWGEALEALVEIECAADPIRVGKPINVLRVYSGGHNWIKNPTKCNF